MSTFPFFLQCGLRHQAGSAGSGEEGVGLSCLEGRSEPLLSKRLLGSKLLF